MFTLAARIVRIRRYFPSNVLLAWLRSRPGPSTRVAQFPPPLRKSSHEHTYRYHGRELSGPPRGKRCG